MSEVMTLYKLIILYMLNLVDFPLLRAHIFDFILYKEYTDYFTLQQVVGDLIDTQLITSKTIRNTSHLTITREGKNTLSFFSNRISDAIKEDIEEFLKEKALELKNESAVQADFYKTTSGDYAAHLAIKEKGECMIDLTLSVPVEEAAISICDNWQKKNQEVYAYLMEQLM